MFIEILCGALVIVVVLMAYIISNLNKKISIYETWVYTFQSEVNQMYNRLKSVDERNLFESDDDVGFVFSEIVRISKNFNDTIK